MALLLKIFVAGTDNFGLIPGMCMEEREPIPGMCLVERELIPGTYMEERELIPTACPMTITQMPWYAS